MSSEHELADVSWPPYFERPSVLLPFLHGMIQQHLFPTLVISQYKFYTRLVGMSLNSAMPLTE